MENKDFDKIFAHKFKQIPGEPYREEGWSDLSGRMDAYERRGRRWMFPVLLPLFGLLAAGNIFWWHQWREVERRHSQTSGHTTTILRSDTIVRTSVVYRYDTIYENTTLLRRYTPGGITENEQSVQKNNTAFVPPAKGITSRISAAKQQPVAEQARVFQDTNAVNYYESPLGQNIKNKPLAQENPAEPAHTISHRVALPDSLSQTNQAAAEPAAAKTDSIFEYLLNNPPVTEKVRKPLLMFARPRVGISAGWGNPLLEHKRSGYLFGAGIGADVEVMQNLRLGAEVHYWKGKLKADETGGLKGLEIPNPGSDYKLRYWETYQIPAFTYAFQLKYLFPLKTNWTPWVGIGSQGATFLPFELEFDFENQNNQLEIFLQGQTRAITHWHGMLLTAGIEKQISPHVSFGAEGFLLRHLNRNPGILDHQIGLKTRLYYNF